MPKNAPMETATFPWKDAVAFGSGTQPPSPTRSSRGRPALTDTRGRRARRLRPGMGDPKAKRCFQSRAPAQNVLGFTDWRRPTFHGPERTVNVTWGLGPSRRARVSQIEVTGLTFI